MHQDFFDGFRRGTSTQGPLAKLIEFFADGSAGCLTRWVKEVRFCRAFIVDGKHGLVASCVAVAAFGLAVGADVENLSAVMLVTHTVGPAFSVVGAGIGVGSDACFHGVASGMQNFDGVACRNQYIVGQALSDRCEFHQGAACERGQCVAGCGDAAATGQHGQCKHGGQTQTAA